MFRVKREKVRIKNERLETNVKMPQEPKSHDYTARHASNDRRTSRQQEAGEKTNN